MRLLKFLIFLFLISGTKAAEAQVFGGTPPSVKWRQINTDAARIIFPQGADTMAEDIAAIAERLNASAAFSLGNRHRKVNIVLHNQTTASNGYVGLGPFRSEFYLTPLQNSFSLGSLPWHKQLVIHEYRHVEQYNNFNVGLSKAFRLVFGEEGQGLANGMVIPDWFFEGDAVFNETRVSEQGRGRLPYFYNGFRALWAAGKHYNWMKLRNGSLQDYTPDHYPLGYLLVAYGYEKYGDTFWKNVTQDAASFKGLFYPFQKAVKQYSGKTYKTFRQDALHYFKEQFDSAESPPGKDTARALQLPRTVTNESYPAFINDSTLIFVKSSYKAVPAFTIRTSKAEKRLRVKDISLDDHFSYRNNRIVYAAYRPDLRWGWRNYSIINILDIRTGKQRTLTRHSRYFAPDINERGDQIAAVQERSDGKTFLHILRTKDGALLKEIPNPEGLVYTYPKFYKATQLITAVRNKDGKMSLAQINSMDGETDFLLPFSFNVIGFPVIRKDTLYFTASAGYTDRLFAFSLLTKELFRLSPEESRESNQRTGGIERAEGIGNYQPAVSSNAVLFSTFTASGFQLQEQLKDKILFIPVSRQAFTATSDFSLFVLNSHRTDITELDKRPGYKITRYPKATGLFNFHSLEPYFDEPDYQLSLIGENVLNTLQSELFFNYNTNEQFKQVGFNGTYGAWFPYVSLGTSYIFDRKALDRNNKTVYWNEAQISSGLSVPLNLSRGQNSRALTIGADYAFKNIIYTGSFKNLDDYSFGAVHGYVSFTNQIQKAVQHIYPRFAQSVRMDYNSTVNDISAHQFITSGSLYWPGFFPNHSIVLNAAYHHRDTLNQYLFSNRFPFSRGYASPNLERMIKWGVNYHLPLFYPDAGFVNIFYLQRVRTNLFYDNTLAKVKYNNNIRKNEAFRSAGTELFFDTKWWNEFPVSFGFRYSYLLDPDLYGGSGSGRFEFILPVNLFQR